MNNRVALTSGLVAVNLSTGLFAAVVGKLLLDLGFEVVRPAESQDPFEEVYPGYRILRSRETTLSRESLNEKLGEADLCIVGGEDHPDLSRQSMSASDLAARFPKLVILEVTGFHPGMADSQKPAVDILVQARTGLVYEHYQARPNLMTFQPAQYGAALQGVIGALGALYKREADGQGRRVATSFFEGALSWVIPWCATSEPDARFNLMTPMDPRPLILRCAGGDYIHVVFGAVGAKYQLYQVLGIHDPEVLPGDPGVAKPTDPPEKFFGDVELIQSYVKDWERGPLLEKLQQAGVPSSEIFEPGEVWDDAQVQHLGLVETLNGCERIAASPFLLAKTSPGPRPALTAEGLPLAGVRVLDFGAFTAGPHVVQPLEELGATVIKVEPLTGDAARRLPRALRASNRGKQSVAINMKTEAGAKIVQQLCADADIIASNFRPGVTARLGIDADTIHASHPEKIILETSGFGPTGPRAKQGAFDLLIQALCGHERRAGGRGNVPIWNRTFLGDYGGGMMGTIALLAALLERARKGNGASLDVSLLATGLFLMSELVQQADGAFVGGQPLNADQTGFHPAECLYEAADGWIAIAVRNDAMALALIDILALEGADADWRGWGEGEREKISAAIRSWKRGVLVETLSAGGVWSENCRENMRSRIFDDAEMRDLGITTSIDDPAYKQISVIGHAFRFHGSELSPIRREPRLGEHGYPILQQLGYSKAAIESLIADNIVKVS